MAVEAKRGCGYRKVGGLYLVSGELGAPCCKLPLPLTVCPTCGAGIKQTRGWTWVKPVELFPVVDCTDPQSWRCPASDLKRLGERAGLLWIGKAFYKTPDAFEAEAAALGVSRRISSIPHGFEVGKTWVLFAHPEAITTDEGKKAGIFRIFRPTRVELIVKQSEFDIVAGIQASGGVTVLTPEQAEIVKRFNRDQARGVTWVPVPDDDPDHQGSVYDKEADDELPLEATT